MQVEVEMVGKSNRWVVDQSTIRIGRGARCDVALPGRASANAAAVQAELLAADGTVRVASFDASQGDVLLNGEPAQAGDVVLSGDVLQIGPGGPELRIRYAAEPASAGGYMPTRVISVGEATGGHEATRLMDIPGRSVESTIHEAASAARRTVASAGTVPAVQPVQPGRPGDGALGAFADKRDRWPAASKSEARSVPPVAAATSNSAQDMTDPALMTKLRNLQVMQTVSLAIIVLMGVWVFQLQREVSSSHDDVRAIRAQDQNAVAQLTPSLDARLNVFAQRMDAMDTMFKASELRMEKGMDEKMKAAETELFTNLDSRMKMTEDRMVNRMNTELPPMLDKYISAKLVEVKH